MTRLFPKYLSTPKVAVFIDAANLEKSVQSMGFKVQYKKLKLYLKIFGTLEYIAYYSASFNSRSHQDFLKSLKRYGYTVVSKPLKKIISSSGLVYKANFDVEISCDAMEIINLISIFILFSGDSDFTYLIQKLRAKGIKVIVISTKNHLARELVMASDQIIDLRKIRTTISKEPTKSPSFATGG